MLRSINNKLASLDIQSLKKMCTPPKPRTCSFEYVKECTQEFVKPSTTLLAKPHECQALQVVKTALDLLLKDGIAMKDCDFSPNFEKFDKACVEKSMKQLYEGDWIAIDKDKW